MKSCALHLDDTSGIESERTRLRFDIHRETGCHGLDSIRFLAFRSIMHCRCLRPNCPNSYSCSASNGSSHQQRQRTRVVTVDLCKSVRNLSDA